MASWIVHLRIAENLLERLPDLEAEKFALGSVAPDSGKPDQKWEHFNPPTQITHFKDPQNGVEGLADLEFYRLYLRPLRGRAERGLVSFRLGYFCHLMTDTLWWERIDKPTRERWSAEFQADPDFIWEVKQDWYGLDFIHVRDHTDCIFWKTFLPARPELGGLDFLVPESLAWSVKHIQEYYQERGEKIEKLYQRPYVFLSRAQSDRFVEEACSRFERIYQYLWRDALPADGHLSSLALPV